MQVLAGLAADDRVVDARGAVDEVERRIFPEVPPRVEYEISDLGLTLAPLFAALAEWGSGHLDAVQQARAVYDGHQAIGA